MPNNEEIDIINIWGLVFNLHQISQHAQVPHHSLPSSPFSEFGFPGQTSAHQQQKRPSGSQGCREMRF